MYINSFWSNIFLLYISQKKVTIGNFDKTIIFVPLASYSSSHFLYLFWIPRQNTKHIELGGHLTSTHPPASPISLTSSSTKNHTTNHNHPLNIPSPQQDCMGAPQCYEDAGEASEDVFGVWEVEGWHGGACWMLRGGQGAVTSAGHIRRHWGGRGWRCCPRLAFVLLRDSCEC